MRYILSLCLVVAASPAPAADLSVDELRAKVGALYAAEAAALSETNDDFRETLTRLEKAVERLEARTAIAPTPAASVAASRPHIVATVADIGCLPCQKWEAETLPALLAKGWRVEVNRVPFGSQVTPHFSYAGRTLDRYTGRADFYGWLRGESAAPVLAVTSSPAPFVDDGITFQPPRVATAVSGRCIAYVGPAGRRWHMSGGDGNVNRLARHVLTVHAKDGVTPSDVSGRSFAELQNIHSHAHEGTWRSYKARHSASRGSYVSAPVTAYAQPTIRMSGCPGGNCPGTQRSAVVMRSGCPSGNCPGTSRSRGGLFGLGLFR